MNYPKHWRLAFVLALFLHFFIWSGMTFLVPLLGAKPTIAAEDAIALEDVPGDDGEEGDAGAEEAEPEETPPQPEPEPEPQPEEALPPEDAPDETEDLDDTSPIVAEDDADAIAQFKQEVAEAKTDTGKKVSSIIVHKGNGQHLNMAPKLVMDYYPPEGLVKFKGRVSVSATIGKDGHVTRTRIMVTSGQMLVDQHAMVAAKKWLFKPALDDKGQPMEVDKIIVIPFNVPNIPRQIEEHNRIGKN